MSTAVGAETTKRAIGAPTIEEINRAYGGVVHVVSGSDFTETVEMAGHYFTFPPRGTCVINDIEDFPWSQSSDGKRRQAEHHDFLHHPLLTVRHPARCEVKPCPGGTTWTTSIAKF